VTLKPGLGSLKVIENDANRSGTHDFLLAFHSNHRPIENDAILEIAVSEINGDFRRKSPIFPTPVYFAPRWRGYPWNWVSAQGSENLEWWVYQVVEKVLR